MVPVELLISLAVAGVLAGLASGLFGVGGGIVTVPAVLFLSAHDFRTAVAISLLSMALTTPIGLWTHHRAGRVRWRTGLLLGTAGLAGLGAATLADPYLPEGILEWSFAGFLLFASHRLAYGVAPLFRLQGGARVLATGFGAGVVAKLLGIGGGVLIVPSLVLGGLDVHSAVATSLVAVETNALVSTGVNLARSRDAWPVLGLAVALGQALGVFLGARTALRSQAHRLQGGFAVVLALVAMSVIIRSLP